ncbi:MULTISPECIES: restriction endonuclease subunit S [unclassified Acinetobacter]|uniref:restriction endonuclease subunit S n=1 Tax=Acinetobacter sp. A1 TaxID=401467 RepID=UPI001447FE5E|nr:MULTISPECIES: restriction endonuclease subunit S [unclassified Acinetobacter]
MTAPKLRFKEFDSDWSKVKLKELVISLDAGVSVNGEDVDVTEDDFSVLKTSCVSLGVFNANERKLVNLENEIQRLKEPLLDNSLVMNRSNTPLLVGSSAFIKKAPKNTYLSDKLWQIKVNDKADIRWLSFHLSSETTLIKLRDMATGTSNSMKNITKSDVLNFELSAPSKQEQTKIASFLSAVDEKVSQLTQKHQLLSQYKQGMMQKLFSQQLRFKADNGSEFGEWEDSKLGELTTLITKGTTPSSLGEKYEESGINFIKIESLSSNGKFLLDKFAYIDENTHNKLARSKLEHDDILFSIAGALGRVAIISRDYLPANTNQALAIIRLKDKKITRYIYYFLNSDYVKKIIDAESVQLAQANFSLGQLANLDVLVPCLEEQTKIANFLSAIDQKIEVVAQQIEQAKQWKKGLLQQMFV